MDDTAIWGEIDAHRARVADLLDSLSPGEWRTPSLCAGWTVHDVGAHLTMSLTSLRAVIPVALRSLGKDVNALIRDESVRISRQLTTVEVIAALRGKVGSHRPNIGLTSKEALIDILVHSQDIALPLGRSLPLLPAPAAAAADRVVSYAQKGSARVFRALPYDNCHLVATDYEWSTGTGPLITGTMSDLLLMLTGRTARLRELSGDGAAILRSRVRAPV